MNSKENKVIILLKALQEGASLLLILVLFANPFVSLVNNYFEVEIFICEDFSKKEKEEKKNTTEMEDEDPKFNDDFLKGINEEGFHVVSSFVFLKSDIDTNLENPFPPPEHFYS